MFLFLGRGEGWPSLCSSKGKGDSKGDKGGKGSEKGGKGSDGKDGGLISYLKAKPATYFTQILEDGHQRALCESYVLEGKCAHGSECIFGSHGGHPGTVTDAMKKIAKARRDARSERNKQYREQQAQRRAATDTKRKLDGKP